ncbi:F-box only protein 36a [Paramormyrops kingsleyae]|uniref:F-box only protein 36a n=1 Tax=Paramormyrops kingsleyae TaxID=1676925 RepID=UPI000CD6073A|nr:F-box only protein 36 [Paramormyrops kingsleyae]
MAPLLGDTVFEISGQGPSPSDDFFQLLVTKKQNPPEGLTNVSRDATLDTTFPAEIRENYQDFLLYPSLQSEIASENQVMVGTSILQYAQHLCQGQFDSLDCLPDAPLLQIMVLPG